MSTPYIIDVDGLRDRKDPSIVFIGEATLQSNGKYRALATVGDALCIVECSLVFVPGTRLTKLDFR